jgi:hypothetical protein
MADFKLSDFESGRASGMDSFFETEPEIISPTGTVKAASAPKRVKVASLDQLKGFQRVSSDTLVNKATQELWSIAKDTSGDFFVQRLFQDDGQPLKG